MPKIKGSRATPSVETLKRIRKREQDRYAQEQFERNANVLEWALDHDADNSWKRYQVGSKLRDGEQGPYRVKHNVIEPLSITRLRQMLEGGEDRDTGSGSFVLIEDSRTEDPEEIAQGGKLWMSDTRAEILEHMLVIDRLAAMEQNGSRPRVLINGLGIGMIAHAALLHGAASVDVVELDADVIALTGPMFADDNRVHIYHGDAFTISLPGEWDLIWHDVWPYISDLNLPEMRNLKQRYRARSGWQGCWQEEGCREMARLIKLHEQYREVVGYDDERTG